MVCAFHDGGAGGRWALSAEAEEPAGRTVSAGGSAGAALGHRWEPLPGAPSPGSAAPRGGAEQRCLAGARWAVPGAEPRGAEGGRRRGAGRGRLEGQAGPRGREGCSEAAESAGCGAGSGVDVAHGAGWGRIQGDPLSRDKGWDGVSGMGWVAWDSMRWDGVIGMGCDGMG